MIDTFEITSASPNGQPASFWLVGIIVYGVVVIIANVEIMFQTNIHTVYSFLI